MGTLINALKNYEKKIGIKKKGLTVTVSGKSGTGKTTISESIAKALNLKHASIGDIFRQVAEEKKVDLKKFSAVRDKSIDFEADKRTLELAKKGGIVLNGRLTGWVAGDNADVRIFVTSDTDLIAERVAKRDNKTAEAARKDILERDANDIRLYKKIYRINIEDMSFYDLIINNAKLTFAEAKKIPVKYVKEILKRKRTD